MVGTITIGTEIDTKGFEEDLKKIEKDSDQVEIEAMLKAKGIEIPQEEAQAIADELNENMKLGLDTKSFDIQIAKVKSEILTYRTLIENANALELSDTDILNVADAMEKANNKLISLNEQKEKFENAKINQIKQQFEDMGKSIKKTVKNVAKMVLAIFGIRGAINAVRNAMNIISQGDEELKNDIQFIKTALAYTLEPIIRVIVNLMKTLAQYVAFVVKAWTGRDIFASARKNLKAGAKSAKEINKSMAGFDEAQTLQNNAGGGGAGGGISDIGQLTEGEVPKWLQWIAENKDIVIAGLIGIAGGIGAINLGLGIMQGFGIGLALAGIAYAIENIIKFIKDPSFESFIGICEGIAVAVAGVALAFGAWPVVVGAILALVIIELTKHYDTIVGWFDKLYNWIEGPFYNKMKEIFGPFAELIMAPFRIAIGWAQGYFESFFGGIKKVVNGIVKIFKGDFKGGIKEVFSGLKDILLAPFNAMIGALNNLIKGINKIKFDVPDWVPGLGGKKLGFNIPTIPKLAKGGIVNMPGKGIPVGAMAGERGMEGIIPLTDSQQMAMLGEAIGRYITINATIPVNMNGRLITKELRKIQNESSFATNGGIE